MASSLVAEFFVPKNGTEQTLHLLSKIEVFVNDAGGKYSCDWKDHTSEDSKEGHTVRLDVQVPDRSYVMEINQHLVEIEKIMNDDSSDHSVQQKQTSSETVPVDDDKSLDCSSPQLQGSNAKSERSDKKQGKRSKHKCPYPNCKSEVIHLPRHMTKSHGWSPKKSRSVLNSFGLRKQKSKTKRTYKNVICPVTGCQAVVKRIHNHLTCAHKMKPGSKIYKKCLQHPIRHEVDPISSSESSGELSNASSSSVESYHPQQKKMKDINMNRNDNVYNIVYGNEDAKSEGDLGESEISEDENANADSVDENADVVDAPHFDKKLSQVFDQYETWLRTADGGRKSDRSALQCRRQVELVVSYIDSSNQSLECILDKNRLRDEWLVKFEKEKQPGTVKSYLGTLCNFYAFLKCENFDVGVSVDHLSSLSQQVKLWARSFRKNSMNRFWEKRMEDISTMRTPEQVKTFDTSEVARAAITILGEYKGKEEEISPTQPEYTSVRDYLLTVLCINNGSRSGTLANMTLREFRQATKEDDCFIVRVKDHKTFTTHGPVSVIFTASLFSYTQIFIEKLRNHLEGVSTDGDSAVFLSVTLKKMTSSHVGSQIGSCWGKVFGKEAVLGGATAFRKAAVSAVNEHNEDIRGDLANLMVHKQSTADRYYLLQSKGKSAVKTSKELTRIMRSSGKEDDETAEDEDETSKASGRDGSESFNKRHKWTSAEIAELETAFSSNIDSHSITMEQVKKTVKRIPALQGISPEKIRDKIRSYFRENDGENSGFLSLPAEKESLGDRLKRAGLEKQKNDDGMAAEEITSLDELISDKKEEESVHDDVPAEENGSGSEYGPSTSDKKTMQSLLTIGEDDIFNSTFSTLIRSSKPIAMKKVVAMVEKEAKLSHLLDSFTHRQLADKVRSLRKAFVLAKSKKQLGKRPRK